MTQSSTSTILLVDDNPKNLDILKCYLQPQNYNVCAVTCGEKALKVLEKVNVDLILLDIIMPGIDGYQICKILKSTPRYAHIPIIFVTAKVEPEDLRKGLSLGAIDYITKPVNEDVVIARVKCQLAQAQQLKLERDLMKKEHKMAELGKLVADITHEVASPLGIMMLSIDHIQEQTLTIRKAFEQRCLDKNAFADYMEKLTKSLNLCKTNSVRASEIMLSFKEVAIDQCSQRLIEFDLLNYVENILATLKPKLRYSGHEVSLDIEKDLIIKTYPGALSQVITNLINNSLMHAFKENQVGEISIIASVANNQVFLRYSDNGIGMTETQQQQAFNKFYTTKAGEGGSGLGLAICKELIEDTLEGTISIESEVGSGTVFIITFKKDNELD
ncbi:MAG: hybrid sensor histidine kinase/response regulator [Colwellia sp.]|nr:hybrid sensor histidine kinase/response regulator [Colwellia sp.]